MRTYLLAALGLALACTPRPRPPAADSTVAVHEDSTTADSGCVHCYPADTGVTDSLEWPSDYQPDTTTITAEDVDALTRAAHQRGPGRGTARTSGMTFGMSGYKPLTKWCESRTVINATNITVEPKYLIAMLDAAVACHFRFQPAWARALMKSNGVWNGPFSVTKTKAMIDAYAAVLPPAKAKYYFDKGVFLGWYGLDDMGCPSCNGGEVITQQTTAEVMKYAQQKLGAVPVCLRVHPEWMLRNGATKATWLMPDGTNAVDCVISQWYIIFQTYRPFPTQQQWYANQVKAQTTLGVPAQIFTVTYGGCYKAANADGCPADKMKAMGLIANAQPGSCGNLGWNWRENDFTREPWLSAIRAIDADAGTRPKRDCWRGL